jgi:tetratricopeptide (TPR) repeat protein
MTVFLEDSVFQSVAPLPSWMQKLRDALGVEVAELLLDTLYMASESVDSLVDLLDSLSAAVVEGLVDAVSVHGVYLRQVCLGFEQLSFESVTFLWQEFCDQLDLVPDLREEAMHLSEGGVLSTSEYGDFESQSWPLSMAQVEELLQETCRQLDQAHFSFERVELQVRSMLEKAPDASAAYFLRFLNCLRHKDRTALDALHQFFDQAMIQKQSSTKEILQFSAILLALVHDSFGDPTLALMATEEAVRVAQQAKDQTCVAFALGKLFQNEGRGASGRRELLKRCAARASQEQIRPLVIGSSLGLSLNYLEDETRDPSIIWRHQMEATCEPSADTIPSMDRPTCLSHSPQETAKGLARQTLVEAGIWDSFGIPALSGLASLAILNCHHQSSAEEKSSALTNLARLYCHGAPSQLLSSSQPSESKTRDLDAVYKLLQARRVHGLDGKSFQESFLPPLILQLHAQCLNGRDLQTAKTLESILHSSLPPGSACRDKFIVEIGIQTCYRLCHSHDWSKARELALELLQMPMVKNLHRPKLLILLAGMELESTANRFVSAVPHLMEAITICEESSMYDLHAVALLVLARVFLRMKNPKRALSVLKAAIPALLPRVQCSHQAEAYLTKAKCYLQLAESTRAGPTAPALMKKRYEDAFQGLKTSENLFRQCQNDFRLIEVYYLQARLLFLLERAQECETASQEYLLLQQTKPVQPYRLESLCSMVGVSA